ncbi:glycosyltransferase [Flavobacterium qiangtangense]|uniref:Glycosyltransferase n=1 Tax=Flavobacterium qiangtangense TaxID=1442595 RepID=A0ABW1PQW0_9FLAO
MLAIVIPYYKINYFRDTLTSLANQTCKKFKVYIGDDASSNNPEFLLQDFVNIFECEYFRFEENLGEKYLTKQWERCIDLTADEAWIMILGDDDVLGETVVEEFYKGLERPNFASNVIRCATIVIDEQNKTYSDLFTHPELETGIEFSIRKLKHETRSSLSEYIFKKETYRRHKFTHFPSAFYSDDKAWFDFSEEKKILSLNEAVVYIRVSDFSLSGSSSNKIAREAECQYLLLIYVHQFHKLNSSEKGLLLIKLEDTFYFNKFKDIKVLYKFYFRCLLYFKFDKLIKSHKKLFRKLYHSFDT